jgi:ADP-ribose pyrophosphatase
MDEDSGIVVEHDELLGDEASFFRVRRLQLRNRDRDGALSRPYTCELVTRPKGVDAVVVALWRERDGRVEVFLREALRPAVWVGRRDVPLPVTEPPRVRLVELVAGIVERDDVGEGGLRRRAALEVAEEAGYDLEPESFEHLGAGLFPTPGSMPEKYWLFAVRVEASTRQRPPQGDGSPMEEGAATFWIALDDAITRCWTGEIADCKTEIGLRRLRDRLTGPA